jgi:hypothetical protein
VRKTCAQYSPYERGHSVRTAKSIPNSSALIPEHQAEHQPLHANTDGRYEENDVGGISERSTFADFFAFFAIFLAAFFSVFAAIFASFFGSTINPSASIPVNLSLGIRRILRPRNVFQNLPRDHRQLGDVHRDQECLVAGE